MSNSTIPGQVGSDRLVFVEINANSAQLELRLWLSLAYYYITIGSILVTSNFLHRYINFTFIEAGGGLSENWYTCLNLDRKLVFLHTFNSTYI